jgi:hypothetical protein
MSKTARESLATLVARLTRWAYKPYPPIDADGRDPYRWCIYCGCDCYDDEPEHRPDCASLTGLRPIRPRDLGMRGPNDPYAHGMRCMDCGDLFKLGDFSALRPTEEGHVFEVVCVGCRVLNPESAG